MDDFYIAKKGSNPSFWGNQILFIKAIDKTFIEAHKKEFDIVNVSDILAEEKYNTLSEDVIYNDTDQTVNVKCRDSKTVFTIKPYDYQIFDWMEDGDLIIE